MKSFVQRTVNRRTPRRRLAESGTGIVEYAFVFMVLLTMIFAIMGFGHALYAYHFVNHAAKEATRYAAVRGRTCATDADGGTCQASNSASGTAGPTKDNYPADLKQYVQNITPPGIDASKVTVTATWTARTTDPPVCSQAVAGIAGSPYADYPGCTVQVQVQYNLTFLMPLITNSQINLSSTSDMIIAH